MRNWMRVFSRSIVTSKNVVVYFLPCVRVIPAKGRLSSILTGYFSLISDYCSGLSEVPSTIRRSLSNVTCSCDVEHQNVVFDVVFCALVKSPTVAENLFTDIELFCKGERLSGTSMQRGKDEGLRYKVCDLFLIASDDKKVGEASCRILKTLVVSTESLPSACYLKFAACCATMCACVPLLKLVKDLVDELPTSCSKVVVNRMIFSFGVSRQFEMALSIFHWMKRTNFNPDLITYNTILQILGRAGLVDEMLKEFESMKNFGIRPDFISYNTLLNQLRKVGRLDICLIHYENMLQGGIHPDLLTFTALIESLGRSGNVAEALRLFTEMKNRRIRPSLYVFRSLIKNLKRMGKMELALKMVEEMNSTMPNLAGPLEFKRLGRK